MSTDFRRVEENYLRSQNFDFILSTCRSMYEITNSKDFNTLCHIGLLTYFVYICQIVHQTFGCQYISGYLVIVVGPSEENTDGD